MANLRLFLSFENAKEALEYYTKVFYGEVIEHYGVTKEMNAKFKLPEEKLGDSTFFSRINISGVNFACADRFEGNSDYTDAFDIMLEFSKDNEEEKSEYFKLISSILEFGDGKMLYDNVQSSDEPKMFRYRDKYNINWSMVLG